MAHVIRRGIRTQLLLVSLVISLCSGRAWAQQCLGDCNGDNSVSASELTNIIGLINCCPCSGALLGGAPDGCSSTGGCQSLFPSGVPQCAAADRNGNSCISAGELTGVIADILDYETGCPPPATATPTNTLAPTNTPTNTRSATPTVTLTPAVTFTPTNTPPNTATPTNTVPPTATNTSAPTATNTSAPTATNTSAPTATNTTAPSNTPTATNTTAPSSTPTSSQTPTPTATSATPPVAGCGNGVVEGTEVCDDGGYCVGGPNDGQKCPSGHPATVPGGVDCGIGTCTPFGGDGCAVNCTPETTLLFPFTGAQCWGGPDDGQTCHFLNTCVGGTLAGAPCILTSQCGSGGVCMDECGTTLNSTAIHTRCAGLGTCTAGDANKIGIACPAGTAAVAQKLCVGGTNAGSPCTSVGIGCPSGASCQCPGTGAQCLNPCSPVGGSSAGLCTNGTRSLLQSLVLGGLPIGPISGHNTLDVGQPRSDDPNKLIPVAGPADGLLFEAVKVPALACSCPHGVAEPSVHGPGNSSSGWIGCSAAGLPDANVDLAIDHNTTPPHTCIKGTNAGQSCSSDADCPGTCLKSLSGATAGATCHSDNDCGAVKYNCSSRGCNLSNGAGACNGGTRAGLGCATSADCPSGTCSGAGQGGGICVGGTQAGKPCHVDSDCPGSICNSPDDTTGNCTAHEPPLPEGSDAQACLEIKTECYGGRIPGAACQLDVDCNFGACGTSCASCGSVCNQLATDPGVCNGPARLSTSAAPAAMGTALIISTTAIGVIATPADPGTCSTDRICTPFTFGTATKSCQLDVQCGTGNACSGAYCGGLCGFGADSRLVGKGCTVDNDCGAAPVAAGTCVAGANFGKACTGVAGECGAQNVCIAVNQAKGYDGIPCTADDPPASQGLPATIPTTTAIASCGMSDVNNIAGGQIYTPISGDTIGTGYCTGKTSCETAYKGAPFDCTGLLANPPTLKGSPSLVAAFPEIDAATTADGVILSSQTAKTTP